MARTFLAVAFAAVAFAALWRWSDAAVVQPHGQGSSGVPYTSRGLCLRNDTYYASEVTSAMDAWNASLGGTWYYAEQPGCLDGHIAYSGSQADLDWSAWFGALSCNDYDNLFPTAHNVRAFEYGHNPYYNDSRYVVVCLNVASAFPYRFQDVPFDTRVLGLEHEFGHGLHLGHVYDTAAGVMNECWCWPIQSDEVTAIGWTYASPP